MPELVDSATLVAVHGHPRAARLVARGLRGLAHRGGVAAGVVALAPGARARSRREPGVAFLDDEPALDVLVGDVAVGQRHARPLGDDAVIGLADAERLPPCALIDDTPVVLGLAGALVDPVRVRHDVIDHGVALLGDGPEELLLHLLARSRQRTLVNRLVDALWKAPPAGAVVAAAPGVLVAVRDPHGIRPLVLGRLDGATVVASEEAALVRAGAAIVRALAPGEMLIVDARGAVSVRPFPARHPAPCVQELVQLAAPTSSVDGVGVWQVRGQLGEELAREAPVRAGTSTPPVVVGLDADAAPGARGFAAVAGLTVERALEVGGAAVPELVAGRAVALVAGHAGASVGQAVSALFDAGAAEVHLRVVGPRRSRACPYGIDGPALDASSAAGAADGVDEAVARRHGLASVAWLSRARLDGVLRAAGLPAGAACTGCLGGPWPVELPREPEVLPL
ncbi:MAG: hypothetical protein H6733_08590 [Alphaproteobacteria bacterium]|nr:hypothetical protein [Alphaproteobacteria bacterium]